MSLPRTDLKLTQSINNKPLQILIKCTFDQCFLLIISTKKLNLNLFPHKSETMTFCSQFTTVVFASLQSQLCVCMMSQSDNRVVTVSHLIPSHSWMPWIFTEQLSIKNENNQETSKQLWYKNPVSSSCFV